jgi:signal transduction histidine kinase
VTPIVLALAALAIVATGLLYAVTDAVIRRESDAALARAVDVEIAALADVFATGGRDELIARIGDRLAMRAAAPDQTHYMLADGSGRRIAGDVARWPLLSAENSQSGYVVLGGGTPVFARATQLAPDLRVIAAREYDGPRRLLSRVRASFLLAGAAILCAALALGWAAAARLRRRVERLNAALRTIEAGDLQCRLPQKQRDDELGELARHANGLVERLSGVIQAQREVTDHVAHELRTPLMHLNNRLLRLIERAVDPELAASLGDARREVRGIAELLDSLLDIAANEVRRGDPTGLKQISLSKIACSLADLYADSASEMEIAFIPRIAPGVEMLGDAMQLTRAISNLLDNAFKYAGAGSTVELIVEDGPRIEVRDDGPGVPEADCERIFERFRRGADSGKGHGLGLALVRAIAERHDLRIRCTGGATGAAFVIEPEEMR